ncbi:MAG: hypothetical protein AAGF85_07250 [Bacteroidota bacterium]
MTRVIAIFMIFLASCQSVQPSAVDEYISIQDLLNSQYELLTTTNSSLSKRATSGSDSSYVFILHDSVQWKKELGIFERLEINQPKLKGKYEISIQEDQFSNLTITSYTTLDNEAEVKYLKLYYLDDESNFRKIEAEWQESNPIYTSKRILNLFFEDLSGEIILSGYEVTGSQKMLLQDEDAFSLKAKVERI